MKACHGVEDTQIWEARQPELELHHHEARLNARVTQNVGACPMISTILLIALGFIVAVLYTAVRRMSVELTSSKKRFLA